MGIYGMDGCIFRGKTQAVNSPPIVFFPPTKFLERESGAERRNGDGMRCGLI